MANILSASKSNAIAGLGTWEFTVLTAGVYKCEVEAFIVEGSALSVTISNNATLLATSIAPTSTTEAVFVDAKVYGAVNDVISVVLSSSSAIDTVPNNVKSIISVGRI